MDCKFILVFMCCCMVFGQETTTEVYEDTTEVDVTTVQTTLARNKTLSELVKEQTDAIRKILSENKGGQKIEYPEKVVAKQATKEEKEKQSIEELKLKCMNFFKLGYGSETTTTTEQPEKTAIPFGPAIKPEFLKPKPSSENVGNFFYITHHPAEIFGYRNTKIGDKLEVAASDITEFTEKPQEIFTEPPTTERATEMPIKEEEKPQKFKYVKLEPLVLQKTMLTNGKTYFYWYKPLPNTQSFVQIPDIPENENVETIAQPQDEPSKKVPLPEQYQYYIDPNTGNIIRNLKPKPTTPTPQLPQENIYKPAPQFYLNPQNGMIYQHATPKLVYHKKPEQPTEAPTTEAPKTVPNYTIDYPQNPPQKNEIRYVIPMVVASQEELEKYHMNPSALLANKKLVNFPINYFNNYQEVKPTEERK